MDALPSVPPPAPGPALLLNDAGVPGRTRPLFEELPPGPPAWPGWIALGLAFAAIFLGLAISYAAGGGGMAPADALLVAACLLGGAALLLVGLVWVPLAGLLRRRVLPADRYRGGSVLALFLLALVGGGILAVPLLLALVHWDAGVLASPPPRVVTFELFVTPASLLTVLAVFVALPRALPGLRLWRGSESLRQLAIGGGLGIITWLAISVAAAVVQGLLKQLGIELEGQQEVVSLATQVSPVVAVLAIAVMAPLAEELFFRGLAFNAWEREYGTRRALFGSAFLFSAAHLAGGGGIPTLVITFVLGLILGLVYSRTRTITTTIGLHAVFNLTTLALLFLGAQ